MGKSIYEGVPGLQRGQKAKPPRPTDSISWNDGHAPCHGFSSQAVAPGAKAVYLKSRVSSHVSAAAFAGSPCDARVVPVLTCSLPAAARSPAAAPPQASGGPIIAQLQPHGRPAAAPWQASCSPMAGQL